MILWQTGHDSYRITGKYNPGIQGFNQIQDLNEMDENQAIAELFDIESRSQRRAAPSSKQPWQCAEYGYIHRPGNRLAGWPAEVNQATRTSPLLAPAPASGTGK
jgi:hypothetical protein